MRGTTPEHTAVPSALPASAGSSPVLRVRDLAKSYGRYPVLDGVALDAAPGHRLGLVGENGAGKSTLLRLVAGLDAPDTGEVQRPLDTALLDQELPYPGSATLGEVVDDALAPSHRLEARLAELATAMGGHPGEGGLLDDYARTLELAEAHEVWDADRRAEIVLAGLALADLERDRRVAEISGGQRSRLALAALLIRRPRALLLDEPTNDLDDAAVEFLEAHLRALPGVVLLASHDRVFLDEVCTGILDLDPSRRGPAYYGGAYTTYLGEKRLERERWQQQHNAEQEELRQLRYAVHCTARQVGQGRPRGNTDKMSYDAHGERAQSQISRRVRNARRRLTELERDQVPKPPPRLAFDAALTAGGSDDTVTGGTALIARDVRVPGRLTLDHLDLPVTGRLLVTGPNGAGKSTLLYALAGRLDPGPGTVQWRPGTRVALLEQDVRFDRPELSPRRHFEAAMAGRADTVRLTDLGLIAPRDIDRPVGALSVGQRRRLALALLVGDPPHLLLLDEPTNHLSLSLAEELEEALRTAPGAVVMATHDRWLRRNWDGAHLRLEAGCPAGRVSPARIG